MKEADHTVTDHMTPDAQALEHCFAAADIDPDPNVRTVILADLPRLRSLARTVHAVREADDLDAALTFVP